MDYSPLKNKEIKKEKKKRQREIHFCSYYYCSEVNIYYSYYSVFYSIILFLSIYAISSISYVSYNIYPCACIYCCKR